MNIGSFVFGLAGLLALICFMPPLAGRIKLPYSVFLAICGCLLAYASHVLRWAPPVIGDFLGIINTFEISSETFLIVFLPILLFETALSMNVRRLMDDIGPILMMAIVAVVVSTLLVGLVLTEFSGMSLAVCLLLGAIVSTTDPAAVIGIFREVGAPKRLTTLVEGESLLNDAAAIALYSVLLGVLSKDTNWVIGLVVKEFLLLFLGGGLAGFVIGRLACASFAWLRGWPAAEISLTVAVAYLSFFISEHYLHVSGVVATVVAGLVVGSTGRTRMSTTTFETLSHSWHQFGFWANSLIFLFAAMLIPKMIQNISWVHAVQILLVFISTLTARAVVVFGLIPLLSSVGFGARVGSRFKTVIWWGGLRGAVSLALALAVTERASLPADEREFIAISVTGFVLATLFINGLTLQPLIRMLGLTQLTKKERALRNQAVVVAATLTQHETDEIAREEHVPDEVRQRIRHVFDESMTTAAHTHIDHFSEQDRIDLGLSILARREFEIYFDILKHQIIDRNMAEMLIGKAERLEDAVRVRGLRGFNVVAARALRYPRRFRQALRVSEIFGIQRWLAHELSQRFVALMCMRSVSRQLLVFADQKLRDILGNEATEHVRQAHQRRLDLIAEGLQALELQYPTYSLWLHERYLGRIARRIERERYDEMLEQSLISGEVYADLTEQVGARWGFIDRDPPLDIQMGAADLVARVPMLNGLTPEVQRQLAKLLTPRLFLPDQLIWSQKLPPFALYIVASGAVKVLLPDHTHIELGSGEFFGELYMLAGEKMEEFEVRSLGYSKLLCLPARDFEALLSRDPVLRESIELVARQRMRALEVWRNQPVTQPPEQTGQKDRPVAGTTA
jgi:CPA1 family monovalent cation:H+ antiporter